MSKSKKKSTFFWICVILTIIAIVSLIVYLVICNCNKEPYYACKFKPIKSRSKYHHLNDLFCCEDEQEDAMIKVGGIRDGDSTIRDSAGYVVPENVRKFYIESQKLLVKQKEIAKEAAPLEEKENRTEEEEKKLKQLLDQFKQVHIKEKEAYDRYKFGGMTRDEYYKKYEKIKGFMKKIAKYSCAQKSENPKLCEENFMKCANRCVDITDEDILELGKLEKEGDMKKIMEYVKKNILDKLKEGECKTKKDVSSLVEVDGSKVIKENSMNCYNMISNYFF